MVANSCDYLNSDNYEYSSALILFPTVFLFITAKKISHLFDIRLKLNSVIVWIGGTTFGIYLLEGVFERVTSDSYFLSNRLLPPLLSWLIWAFLSFLVGCLAVSVYKLFVYGFKYTIRYLGNRKRNNLYIILISILGLATMHFLNKSIENQLCRFFQLFHVIQKKARKIKR